MIHDSGQGVVVIFRDKQFFFEAQIFGFLMVRIAIFEERADVVLILFFRLLFLELDGYAAQFEKERRRRVLFQRMTLLAVTVVHVPFIHEIQKHYN